MTFTVQRNFLLCLQASQNDPLFPWRQISFTASNSLLLEGKTYLRSACGSSSTPRSTEFACKVRILSGNFVELCPSLEMSLIQAISGFGCVSVFSAYLSLEFLFIFISKRVHRPSECLLRRLRMSVRIHEITRQMVEFF